MGIELYSNNDVKALIKSLITKKREPHSIAVCGDRGLGKKAMARYIAASLLCEQNNGEPCGKCKACRMMAHGVHPDFIEIKSNDNGNYQVDVIREMVSDAVVKPNEGRVKIYLIPDLDRSANTAVQVQNILLKLIEEPPEHCVIILTAASKEIFLQTVISRVLCLRVSPCSKEDSVDFLKKAGNYSSEEIENAVDFGGGNIGKCIEFLEDKTVAESIGIAENCFTAILNNDEYGFLKSLFSADGKKQLFRRVLMLLSEGFCNACLVRSGYDRESGCLSEQAKLLAERISEDDCERLYEIVYQHLNKLESNANLGLTTNCLTAAIFEMLQQKH